MPLTRFKLSSISDGGITNAKLANDAVNTDELADNIEIAGTEAVRMPVGTTAQREGSPKAGDQRFNTTISLMEYYDGTQWKAIDAPPVLTSFAPTSIGEADASQDIVLTGSNFQSGATVQAIGQDGSTINAGTVVVDSSTQITATFNGTSFSNAQENYDIKVTNTSGLSATIEDGFSVNQTPTWSTASGSLMGSSVLYEGEIIESLSVTATDPDGDTITYSVASGDSLPSGLSLNSASGAITGDPDAVANDTTTTFDIEASDTADNVSTRSFSMVTTNDESAAYESNLKLWLRGGWDGQTSGNQSGNTLPAAKWGTSYGSTNKVNVIGSLVVGNSTLNSSPVSGSTKIKDAQGGVSGLNTVAKQTDEFAYMCDAGDSFWIDIPDDNSIFQGNSGNHTICYWLLWEDRSGNTGDNYFSPTFHSWSATDASAWMAHDWYTNGTNNVKIIHYSNGANQGTFTTPNISGGSNGNKGVWFHAAFTYTNGAIAVYINGQSQSHSLSNTGTLPAIGSNQTCNFNGRGDGYSGGLPGSYTTGGDRWKMQADLRYYNTPLSAGAIADIYNKSRSSFV